MSHSPEIIENKSLKALHYALLFAGFFFALVTVGGLQNGTSFVGPAVLSGIAFFVASKIKFRWTKRGEVAVYK